MKIGILGSGEVGQALGKGFIDCRYELMISSRNANNEKLKSWATTLGKTSSIGSFSQAAAFGDLIVLATLGSGAEEAVRLAGPSNFNGKILIDATNPLDLSKGMPPGLFIGTTDSLGERIQRKLPAAKVVKCFNTVPNTQMINPTPKDAMMLICGNDSMAKEQVVNILKEFGWKGAIDIGAIDGARWLEALTALWVRVGTALNTWDHIFSVESSQTN